MNPISDHKRPDLRDDPSSPWKYLARLVLAAAGLMLLPLYLGLCDALIHPFALGFGRPATAIVSAKRVSQGRRASGNYVELNYQYSTDFAPRSDIRVNDAAYSAIVLYSHVAIHYIPGCSSCIALDEDYGSARNQALESLAIAILLLGFILIQNRFKKKN